MKNVFRGVFIVYCLYINKLYSLSVRIAGDPPGGYTGEKLYTGAELASVIKFETKSVNMVEKFNGKHNPPEMIFENPKAYKSSTNPASLAFNSIFDEHFLPAFLILVLRTFGSIPLINAINAKKSEVSVK
ncbi:MAG: hypothetical protein HQL06_17530 [Nitrospirae bacterium]|nr:hypothetical protein [Nitrospirota bacterium]